MTYPIPKKLGKYDVTKEIDRGSMGIVCLGHDPFIDRAVAIKVAFAEALRDREFSADDIVSVTNGVASKRWLQSRSVRNQWFVPLPKSGQGRPRVYSFAHVMEVTLTIELRRLGFSNEQARAVICNRLRGASKRSAVDDTRDIEAELTDLPDLHSEDCVWAICGEATIPFARATTLADLTQYFPPASGVRLLDVGTLAKRARTHLESKVPAFKSDRLF